MTPRIVAVCRSGKHRFSKQPCSDIHVIAGLGVEGDAHAGAHVQHLSRVRADPTQPNLRQVHLIHQELFAELATKGFDLRPGDLGENITTLGIDLLGLSRDSMLHLGGEVVLRVTGLRNPCAQIDAFAPGLLREVAFKTSQGIIRKAGIMAIVERGGLLKPGDLITVEQPAGPHIALERV
ncbi:MOSC domain-containing protein [Erythrobacter sp. SDW2]|uniref:MOSC domain-containing protein n=1 Tax=Erythrobacter sp. SDW2 TaxID=2907154 RepID=UPI001F388E07|nr:MOSC domain-containing protein [Erythrobacter sp. SDW2]UIP06109.1 MOSC domain-containing protein [Erythrobacter sp. SDW2]